jgi:hypothetical protein
VTIEFIDVDVTFDYIFLTKEDGSQIKVATSWDNRMGLEVAEEYKPKSQSDYKKIF